MLSNPTGCVNIGNGWLDDCFLHMEAGELDIGVIEPKWASAKWHLVPVDKTPFIVIQNDWKSEMCLQVQNHRLVCAPGSDSHDAHWYLERVKGSASFRLRLRSGADAYLHFEDSDLMVGTIEQTWWSAKWNLLHA